MLLAPRRPASKPADVTAVKTDTSSAAAAERHVDADNDEEDNVDDAEASDNSSHHANQSNSTNDAGCSSKKNQHNIKLSSPNK